MFPSSISLTGGVRTEYSPLAHPNLQPNFHIYCTIAGGWPQNVKPPPRNQPKWEFRNRLTNPRILVSGARSRIFGSPLIPASRPASRTASCWVPNSSTRPSDLARSPLKMLPSPMRFASSMGNFRRFATTPQELAVSIVHQPLQNFPLPGNQ